MTGFRGKTPTELSFGTSGLRGLVEDITDLEAYINTRGFLEYLGVRGVTVSLAGDLRPSTDRILAAVLRAIRDAGCTADYLGKIPTPALAYHAIENGRASVMVTGSHIPFDRNGIKFNKQDGEVLKDDEPGILAAVARVRDREYACEPDASAFGDDGALRDPPAVPRPNPAGADTYVERYLKFFTPGFLSGRRVVVYQHSAVGRDLLVEILTRLGAQVVPTRRSEEFIPVDTEDITAERLAALEEMADAERGAEVIVSTDGDSDRPLVAAVDSDGRVRFLGGDLLGIIVAKFLGADTVVVPISTNDAVDIELGSVIKTRIGSPHVVKAMSEARGGVVVGWEANGGFLTGSVITRDGKRLRPLPTRDAVLPILCALYAAYERESSLVELIEMLPPRYSKAGLIDAFPRDESLRIINHFTPGDMSAIVDALRSVFSPELGFDVATRIDTTDGLRIFFKNGDIAHIRPSGNAPQLRIYAVAGSQARADAIVEHALREPDGILRRLAEVG